MSISTGEIVLVVCLALVFAYCIWNFIVVYKYGQTLTAFSYARGANLDTAKSSTSGNTGKGTVQFTCDESREICVEQATAICTGAVSGESNTESNTEGGPEPISAGLDSNGITNNNPYGDFDVRNTVDLTAVISKAVNRKSSATYAFDYTTAGLTCPITYDPKTGAGVRPQLISSYTCVPKGSKCSSSVIPWTPIVPVNPTGKAYQVKGPTGLNVKDVSMNNKGQMCAITTETLPSGANLYCTETFPNTTSNGPVEWSSFLGGLDNVSLTDTQVCGTKGNLWCAPFQPGCGWIPKWASPTWVTGSPQSFALANNNTSCSTTGVVNGYTQCNYGGLQNMGSSWSNITMDNDKTVCGVEQGKVYCQSKYGSGAPKKLISTPSEYGDIVKVAINNHKKLCALTTDGVGLCIDNYEDVGRFNDYASNNWNIITNDCTECKLDSIAVDDYGLVCGASSKGEIWCFKP